MADEDNDTALIVIDAQRDFCAGGALEVSADNAFLPKVNALIAAHPFVILTQEWHPADHISFAANHARRKILDTAEASYGEQILWPAHCAAGTAGAAFHPALKTDTARLILRKGCDRDYDCYSAFFDAGGRPTGLGGFLRDCGFEKLCFCGLATDFCVAYSALDAARLGFKARVALAACQAIDINGSYDRALKSMQAEGVELGLFT